MIYEIFVPMAAQFHALNVFRYITVRAAGAALTAFLLSLLAGPMLIRFLTRLKVGQQVRSDGPETHLKKSGTPTMGGVLMLWALVVSSALWARLDNRSVWLVLAAALWFGFVGFIDDFRKLVLKHPGGLSMRHKFFLQLLGACGLMAAYFASAPADFALTSLLNIPFVKEQVFMHSWAYFGFGVFVLVGASNAVNFTDGLDGLAAGTSAFSGLTFALFAYVAGHAKIAGYLLIPFVPDLGEAAVVCAALVGVCLGFLWFNAHPAQVFMGDTGSLMLGGVFGIVAILAKQEILLALVGGVFVFEALSVILQILSFQTTGRRIFRMAPLHHHFELQGVPESKVIVRFWIVAALLVLAALSTLKLR